jgi:hypothetical protein
MQQQGPKMREAFAPGLQGLYPQPHRPDLLPYSIRSSDRLVSVTTGLGPEPRFRRTRAEAFPPFAGRA